MNRLSYCTGEWVCLLSDLACTFFLHPLWDEFIAEVRLKEGVLKELRCTRTFRIVLFNSLINEIYEYWVLNLVKGLWLTSLPDFVINLNRMLTLWIRSLFSYQFNKKHPKAEDVYFLVISLRIDFRRHEALCTDNWLGEVWCVHVHIFEVLKSCEAEISNFNNARLSIDVNIARF